MTSRSVHAAIALRKQAGINFGFLPTSAFGKANLRNAVTSVFNVQSALEFIPDGWALDLFAMISALVHEGATLRLKFGDHTQTATHQTLRAFSSAVAELIVSR
jgi:hypothetical protein